MKKSFIFIFIITFLFNSASAQTIKKVSMKEVVQMIDSSKIPMVINFWASWCKPCVQEIPWFEKAIATFKNKNIQLVLVSLDFKSDYPNTLTQFVKKKGFSSKVLWLNETNADYFCPLIDSSWSGNIPATLMVNHAKKYRQFFDQQIPEARLMLELNRLVQ
jgi:thiol-disulfide isomerase/thioredoxin